MGKRGISAYTEVGRRMIALSQGQERELAEVLGVSQQSVSKKVRGQSAISVSDLEKLSAHYNVPMDYFFGDQEEMPPELEEVVARATEGSGPFRALFVRLGGLPDSTLKHIDSIVEAIEMCIYGRRQEGRNSHDEN